MLRFYACRYRKYVFLEIPSNFVLCVDFLLRFYSFFSFPCPEVQVFNSLLKIIVFLLGIVSSKRSRLLYLASHLSTLAMNRLLTKISGHRTQGSISTRQATIWPASDVTGVCVRAGPNILSNTHWLSFAPDGSLFTGLGRINSIKSRQLSLFFVSFRVVL